ncbi:hypothetical protein DB88DRAFT_544454 [Papiliotrema laurentii]|uniref:Uncharacterized protein n=1 Tax=Papiliotrema laurentii TaxID=5418 RepID=A0AAD9FU60_PAPLA|nr:hypothetical protein DB88DRAFT_544454 [Papiliotrema laurentii]
MASLELIPLAVLLLTPLTHAQVPEADPTAATSNPSPGANNTTCIWDKSALTEYLQCQKNRVSSTALIGGAIGVTLAILALVYLCVWLCNRKTNRRTPRQPRADEESGSRKGGSSQEDEYDTEYDEETEPEEEYQEALAKGDRRGDEKQRNDTRGDDWRDERRPDDRRGEESGSDERRSDKARGDERREDERRREDRPREVMPQGSKMPSQEKAPSRAPASRKQSASKSVKDPHAARVESASSDSEEDYSPPPPHPAHIAKSRPQLPSEMVDSPVQQTKTRSLYPFDPSSRSRPSTQGKSQSSSRAPASTTRQSMASAHTTSTGARHNPAPSMPPAPERSRSGTQPLNIRKSRIEPSAQTRRPSGPAPSYDEATRAKPSEPVPRSAPRTARPSTSVYAGSSSAPERRPAMPPASRRLGCKPHQPSALPPSKSPLASAYVIRNESYSRASAGVREETIGGGTTSRGVDGGGVASPADRLEGAHESMRGHQQGPVG